MIKLPKVGLGTFPLSGVFSPVSRISAERVINKYIELGGCYIQTAPYYKNIDTLVSEILQKTPRNKYILGTMCVKNRFGVRSGKYVEILHQCEDSLRALRTDHLDYYIISTTKAVDASFEETILALAELKKQQKITYIGVSNVSLDQLKLYNLSGDVDVVQLRLSLLDQTIDPELGKYCRAQNIRVIVYNSIEWGLLTNRFIDQKKEIMGNDLRYKLGPFGKEQTQILKSWMKKYLRPISQKYQLPIETMAILWCLHQPGISSCLVGASSEGQVVNNMLATISACNPMMIEELSNAYLELLQLIKNRYGSTINDFFRNSYKYWSV